MRWAEFKAGSLEPRSIKVGQWIEQLILDSSDSTALSEITLAELYSNLCTYWRDNQPLRANYDEEWCGAVQREIMKWIGDGAIQVLPEPNRLVLNAINH